MLSYHYTCDRCQQVKQENHPNGPEDWQEMNLVAIRSSSNKFKPNETVLRALWCEACCVARKVQPKQLKEDPPTQTLDQFILDMITDEVSDQFSNRG